MNVKQLGTVPVTISAGTAVIGHVIVDSGTVTASNAFLLDSTFTGRINTLGQKTMASSTPVVIASDQSAVPVSGTVAVSTALLLDATFTGRINTQGQKTMAASTPVVLASDQSTVTISGTVTANGGTSPSLANAWNIKVTDGTNTSAVKAASTAALATDPSLVVAFSPNSALPTGANAIGKLAANSGINIGDIGSITTAITPGTAAANLGKAEDAASVNGDTGIFVLGIRSDVPNLPTAATTSANGDYAQVSVDNQGVQWTRKRQLVSYSATYRLVDATAGQLSLTFTFAANTNKQLATIYHAVGATKTVKIRKIVLNAAAGASGVFNFEVRALSAATAPATGNPAITPRQHDPADGAAEATCLALPTTAGSLVGADTGVVSEVFEWNSAAVGSVTQSSLAGEDLVLYEYKDGMEMKPLIMRAATAEGFAINGRCTAAVALRYAIHILFTEE